MLKELTQVPIKYSHEQREQSLFRDESCCWYLDFSLTGGWLNRRRLFLWMGSVIGFVSLTQALTDVTVTLVPSQLLVMVKTVYDCCVCPVSGVQYEKNTQLFTQKC